MAANDTDTNPATGPAPKKSNNSLLPIIVVILLVPALCYGVMEFVVIRQLKSASGGGDHSKTENHDKPKSDLPKKYVEPHGEYIAKFGAVVVNIAGTGNSRILRVDISLQSSDKDIQKIIDDRMGPLKYAAIRILSSYQLDQVNNNEQGMAIASDAILRRFNQILGAEVIDRIFFTEYIVQ